MREGALNLDCIMSECFCSWVIERNIRGEKVYLCNAGYDRDDRGPDTCKSYSRRYECAGGLVFREGEYTKEYCQECTDLCASTACPVAEKRRSKK